MLVADIIRHESQPSSLQRTGETTNRKRTTHAGRILGAINPDGCPMPPRTAAGEVAATCTISGSARPALT